MVGIKTKLNKMEEDVIKRLYSATELMALGNYCEQRIKRINGGVVDDEMVNKLFRLISDEPFEDSL